MIQSENINELLATIAEVQFDIPSFPKNAKAYGYNYTDLDTITAALKPILHKHGVGYMQSVGGGLAGQPLTLTTRIFNKSGQWIEDSVVLPEISSVKNNAAQTLGMSITYMRRYTLCAMFGITSDEDVDANLFDRQTQQNTAREKTEARKEQNRILYKDVKEATAEQAARMKELGAAKYTNGNPIFSIDEKKSYIARAAIMTAQELIEFMENALRNRNASAPELPENKQK
jgi:hypothetical protein